VQALAATAPASLTAINPLSLRTFVARAIIPVALVMTVVWISFVSYEVGKTAWLITRWLV